jgi:hypothetical protein
MGIRPLTFPHISESLSGFGLGSSRPVVVVGAGGVVEAEYNTLHPPDTEVEVEVGAVTDSWLCSP